MTESRDSHVLSEGTRLLHIGPHKTGTTSVQSAFHAARRAVEAQGVHFAGPNRHPLQAAQAAATRTSPRPAGSMRAWRNLLAEVRRQGDARVVISSEWLSDATTADIRLLVEDLDRERVHVVVTLRPLHNLLASQWQQYVQGGSTTPYLRWLSSIFEDPSGAAASGFWHRHRHDRLIERWAEVVGVDRVTAVVADDRDHGAILRVFEGLLALTEGTLALVPDRSNRSLTWAEVELIRAMNASFATAGVGSQARLDLVLFGAASNLKARQPAPDEPRISTPAWAIERADEVANEIVAGLRASGVRVIGDAGTLAPAAVSVAAGTTATLGSPASTSRQAPDDASVATAAWPEIAATGVMGLVIAAGLARRNRAGPGIDAYSSQRLRSVLLGRIRSVVGVA